MAEDSRQPLTSECTLEWVTVPTDGELAGVILCKGLELHSDKFRLMTRLDRSERLVEESECVDAEQKVLASNYRGANQVEPDRVPHALDKSSIQRALTSQPEPDHVVQCGVRDAIGGQTAFRWPSSCQDFG